MSKRAHNIVKLPRKLPKQLRPLFWDCWFYRVNGETHGDFVAYRILEAGDWKSIKWLCRVVGDETLRQLVCQRRGRGLSREQLRFWQAMWNLPKRLVDEWLKRGGDNTWDRRAG